MAPESTLTLPLIGLFAALWMAGAAWAIWRGMDMQARARKSLKATSRLTRLVDGAPAIPVIIRADGRLDAAERFGRWLGLNEQPRALADLYGGPGHGLSEEALKALIADVRHAQKGGGSFKRALDIQGSNKQLMAIGGLADGELYPNGAALVWFFDASDSEARIAAAEAARREAEAAFAALSGLIEAAPFPMWHRAPDLRLSLVNRAYVDAVGAESAAAVIAGGVELIEPVGDLSPIGSAAIAVDTGEAQIRDLTTTIFGQRRQVRAVDVPLGAAGVAGYAIDTQDAAELAREYKQFANAQRAMLDNMSAAVAQFDAEKNLTFTNLPFRRLFAMKDEWLAERPDFARLLDRMREAGRVPEVRDPAEWRAALDGWFRSPEPKEESWLLPDGTHIRVLGSPVPDGGLLMLFEDRTEQVQLASARDTLLRVRTATFDNLYEAVAVFAQDGRLNIWNRRFADVWGVEESVLAQHPRLDTLMDALAPALDRAGQMAGVTQKIRIAMAERRQKGGAIALKNGAHYQYTAIPLPDGNVLLTLLDVTDSQRAEAALRDRNEALSEASEIKSKFLSNMGYELRTPLTSIGGFAEMLKAGIAGDLPPQAVDYVDAIHEASARLSAQIEAIMDFSQSEAGALPIAKTKQAIAPLLEGVLADHRGAAGQAGVTLRTDIKPSLGDAACDARRLSQAVALIIDNAVRYNAKGGEVLLYADGTREGARIIVSDNGPGMDARTQARVFDGFARSASEGEKGGLGLPLARKLIEAHGGTLELVSEVGQGTMLTIVIPRK